MDEISFCPFCDAPRHKILGCNEKVFFCKECSRFFSMELLKMACPKCGKTAVSRSDFPSPSGEAVFQCDRCRKAFGSSEFLRFNKVR